MTGGPRAGARGPGCVSGYFLALQVLVDSCQSPPALSQSALLVIFEKSVADPDGLADGEALDPDEEPEPDPVPELLGVLLPAPLLEPAPLAPPLLVPPLAAAMAGASPITAIRLRTTSLFILDLLQAEHDRRLPARRCSNIGAADPFTGEEKT